MPTTTSPVRSAAGRIAALSRSRTVDDPDLVNARRDLHAARAEEYVNKLLSTAPVPRRDQLDRLAAILQGVAR